MPKISLKNISFTYRKRKKDPGIQIFDDLNIDFESNKTTVIMGDSGSGKTTLLRLIIGLIDSDDGYIYFDDKDVTFESVFNRNISYVSQELGLYPHFTIFKNIAFPLLVKSVPGDEIKDRVSEIAKQLKIEQCLTRKPRELSIGQNQRVAIARAIIKRPSVFIFDEPFSNLDPKISFEIKTELRKLLVSLNATCIFVTHNGDDALFLADNIVVLKDGKIIENGKKDKVFKSKNTYTRKLFYK